MTSRPSHVDSLNFLGDIQKLIEDAGGSRHADILADFIGTILRAGHLDRGDLKILHRTVRELRYAFSVYTRYRHIRKVSIYGSARTQPTEPAYRLASVFARRITAAGFMVITGAGDGIMRAAQEGAGREKSFGLNIMLPFEQEANDIILHDPKLIYLKYFFTRKLLFVKETDAFTLFPGGFGTHDEAFEALTLMQTGKCDLQPIVFLDSLDSTYWQDWLAFIQRHMLDTGLISPSDLNLFIVTTDPDEAVHEITTFYHTFHSARYVDGQLVIRLNHPLSEGLLVSINQQFRDILTHGDIIAAGPNDAEADEVPHLPRLHLWFNRTHFGRLRQLINAINRG